MGLRMVGIVDEPEFLARLGGRIAALRSDAGLSQQEMATRAGVARSFYARLENGTHNPSVSTLLRIARVHGLTLVTLLAGVEGG